MRGAVSLDGDQVEVVLPSTVRGRAAIARSRMAPRHALGLASALVAAAAGGSEDPASVLVGMARELDDAAAKLDGPVEPASAYEVMPAKRQMALARNMRDSPARVISMVKEAAAKVRRKGEVAAASAMVFEADELGALLMRVVFEHTLDALLPLPSSPQALHASVRMQLKLEGGHVGPDRFASELVWTSMAGASSFLLRAAGLESGLVLFDRRGGFVGKLVAADDMRAMTLGFTVPAVRRPPQPEQPPIAELPPNVESLERRRAAI